MCSTEKTLRTPISVLRSQPRCTHATLRVGFSPVAAGKPASWYLSPLFRGRRTFTLDLHDAAFDPVFHYATQTSPDRPIQDTVRELLLQAVALDAENGAVRAARLQAYRETRRELNSRLGSAIREIANALEIQVDAPTVSVGNFLTPEVESPAVDQSNSLWD